MFGAARGDLDRIHGQDLGEHQRVTAPDKHGYGLQQHRDADPADQWGQPGGVAQAAIGKTLYRHRQQRADDHRRHQGKGQLHQHIHAGEPLGEKIDP